ncbi:germinal center-associated signaling and motility protein isoform X2 [Saccopteryx leptura]|uniref:germinal center-associated signaling and motility protein isoform X2 n=1 Tax=Saccopteryx leptura TaxID=249018 RepID=UPI00339BB437
MGNSLLRGNRRQQNTQELPWNLRDQNLKPGTPSCSRCWDCHNAEGCFCLPWKKTHIFKARQDFPPKSGGTSSATSQENANQSSADQLCYALVNHSVLGRRPSGNSAEELYENVPPQAERPREPLGGSETEYSLLHVHSTPQHPPSPEDHYELFMPSRISSHTLQQPCPLIPPSEAQFSHL